MRRTEDKCQVTFIKLKVMTALYDRLYLFLDIAVVIQRKGDFVFVHKSGNRGKGKDHGALKCRIKE